MPISSLNSENKTTGSGNYINATGGTITSFTSGGATYQVHTFTSTGSFNIQFGSGIVDYLIVAGGGAGGYLEGSFNMVAGTYPVIVGSGGVCAAGQNGGNGENSSFYTLVSYGGGGGNNHQYSVATAGGSGGGGGYYHSFGGTAIYGQGNPGGRGSAGGQETANNKSNFGRMAQMLPHAALAKLSAASRCLHTRAKQVPS